MPLTQLLSAALAWCLLLWSAPAAATIWQSNHGGGLPAGAYKAGHEANKTPLYICRAKYKNGIHIGKLRPAFRGCSFGYAGLAILAPKYEVFTHPLVRWQRGLAGSIPRGAYLAGQETSGKPLYICRAHYKGGVHIGKVRPGLRGCYFGYGSKELIHQTYEVLASAWHLTQHGTIPGTSLVAGHEANKTPLYICRVKYKNGIHIGKVRPAFKGCNFGYAGKEQTLASYQVLRKVSVQWRPGTNGSIPKGAIPTGYEADGKPLYTCRVKYQGGVHIGKIRPAFRGCNFGYAGKEQTLTSYQIMVRR